MLRCLASTSISFSTGCEKLVGTCMILGTGESSYYSIRRLNGMDIFKNGTSMNFLHVEGVPSQRYTCRLIEEEYNSEYGEWRVAVRPTLKV